MDYIAEFRVMNHRIWLEARKQEKLHYLLAKIKAQISFANTAKLFCAFVFAYAKCFLIIKIHI